MMWVGGRWQRLTTNTLSLALALALGAQGVLAQAPSDAPALSDVVSPEELARIREAIESDPDTRLDLDLTFFLRVVEEPPTFADYLANAPEGWAEITPILPPSAGIGRGPSPASRAVSAGGIDLLDIFRSIGRARREREAQRIRERIDRELALIEGRAPASDESDEPDEASPE